MELNDFLILAVPAITALTQLLKKIEVIPVSSNNAKITAFIASVLIVLGFSYASGQLALDEQHVAQYSVNTLTIFLMSVGLYEGVKKFLKK